MQRVQICPNMEYVGFLYQESCEYCFGFIISVLALIFLGKTGKSSQWQLRLCDCKGPHCQDPLNAPTAGDGNHFVDVQIGVSTTGASFELPVCADSEGKHSQIFRFLPEISNVVGFCVCRGFLGEDSRIYIYIYIPKPLHRGPQVLRVHCLVLKLCAPTASLTS